jgi:glutathione S-transferase
MKLFYSQASPYVRKVLVAAHEAGLAGEIELAPVAVTPIAPDAAVAAANPLSKLPTLITDDGQALYDSRVIVEWLDVRSGGRLLPAAGAPRWRALTLQATADGLLDAALLARYETFLRPEPLRWAEWTEGQLDKVRRALGVLETDFAGGANAAAPKLAEIAVACALGYLDFRFPQEAWRERHPKLAAFEATMAARPSMQATRPPAA